MNTQPMTNILNRGETISAFYMTNETYFSKESKAHFHEH